MKGHLEHLTSLLRVFDTNDRYGDEYTWCCTVRWLSADHVELCGVMSFPALEIRHAVARVLFAAGVRRATIRRRKHGKMREIVVYADADRKLHVLDPHRDAGDSKLSL